MDKNMETATLSWGYMGIVEKKMETTIIGYVGFRVEVDNGQEDGNYHSILVKWG